MIWTMSNHNYHRMCSLITSTPFVLVFSFDLFTGSKEESIRPCTEYRTHTKVYTPPRLNFDSATHKNGLSKSFCVFIQTSLNGFLLVRSFSSFQFRLYGVFFFFLVLSLSSSSSLTSTFDLSLRPFFLFYNILKHRGGFT